MTWDNGKMTNDMKCMLSYRAYAQKGYTGSVTTWANDMNFGMNHSPGARQDKNDE